MFSLCGLSLIKVASSLALDVDCRLDFLHIVDIPVPGLQSLRVVAWLATCNLPPNCVPRLRNEKVDPSPLTLNSILSWLMPNPCHDETVSGSRTPNASNLKVLRWESWAESGTDRALVPRLASSFGA